MPGVRIYHPELPSRVIPSIDFGNALKAQGWAITPYEDPDNPPALPPEDKVQLPTVGESTDAKLYNPAELIRNRVGELEKLYDQAGANGWRKLAEIAQPLGIEAEPTGWRDTIPKIAKAEVERQ